MQTKSFYLFSFTQWVQSVLLYLEWQSLASLVLISGNCGNKYIKDQYPTNLNLSYFNP